MMKTYKKKNFPPDKIRRFLEPGPIVLLTSAHRGEHNIMTMGWHMMLGFDLVGCYIWDRNHSHWLVRRSKECVINVPERHLLNTVIDIGNCHGPKTDKFAKFHLTPVPAKAVDAPLIAECYANFECKLIETTTINRYGLFIFECVKAHVATAPTYPQTVHYRGDGVFMTSGRNTDHRRRFKPEMLK